MIQELRKRLEQRKGERQKVQKNLNLLKSELIRLIKELHRHEEAREIVRLVGLKTQQQLQFHISNITSLALEAVFPHPYELVVEFVQRRNKTECDLYFVRKGHRVDPISESGLGAVDVAAFALRVAAMSMLQPKPNNILILDEPFKHLKGEDTNHKVLDMINEISKKLKIQILMVSDERIPREDIIAAADKVFETKIRKGITKII